MANNPNTTPDPQEPKQQSLGEMVKSKILGQNNENLNDPSFVDKLVDILKDENKSIIDISLDVSTIISEVLSSITDPNKANEERKRINTSIKVEILKTIEAMKGDLAKQMEEIETKFQKRRNELNSEPGTKAKYDSISHSNLSIDEKNKKIEILDAEIEDKIIKENTRENKKLHALKKLAEVLDNPQKYVLDFIAEDARKKKEREKAAKQEAQKKAEEAAKQKEAEEAAKKQAEDERQKQEAEARQKEAEGINEELVEPWDIDVKPIAAFTSPEDIRNAQLKWNNVVNEWGDKPEKGDELHWLDSEGNVSDQQMDDPEEMDEYWRFMDLLAAAENFNEQWKQILSSTDIDTTQPLSDEELHDLAGKITKTTLKSIFPPGQQPNGRTAAILYSLGVNTKQEAYQKFQNALILKRVPTVRKGKDIYEVVTHEGNPVTMTLQEFLEKHGDYGEKMVEDAHRILSKLYAKYKLGATEEEFRDKLIEIIQCKGSRDVGNISTAQARDIYMDYLVMLDKNVGDREILQLLIALKKKPPYVYDLRNTGDGWVVASGKKTHENALEDFRIDGAFYVEFRRALRLSGSEFNKFIIKIAPIFEKLRSFIANKNKTGEKVTAADVNKHLGGTDLTESDLKNFYRMMKIERWSSKVGHVYKHALYFEDTDAKVPEMKEIQGQDNVDQIDVMFVNVEEKLRRIAQRLADERLDQELKEAGPQGWRQLWRVDKIACKWWKRNALEGYRERYVAQFMQRLKEDPRYRTELMTHPGTAGTQELKPSGKWGRNIPGESGRQDINADLDAIAERFGIAWDSPDRDTYLTANKTVSDFEN